MKKSRWNVLYVILGLVLLLSLIAAPMAAIRILDDTKDVVHFVQQQY